MMRKEGWAQFQFAFAFLWVLGCGCGRNSKPPNPTHAPWRSYPTSAEVRSVDFTSDGSSVIATLLEDGVNSFPLRGGSVTSVHKNILATYTRFVGPKVMAHGYTTGALELRNQYGGLVSTLVPKPSERDEVFGVLTSLATSSDKGKLLAGFRDGMVRCWSVGGKKPREVWNSDFSKFINDVDLAAPDGLCVVGYPEEGSPRHSKVVLLNLRDGREVFRFTLLKEIAAIRFRPGTNELVISHTDGSVAFYSRQTGKELRAIPGYMPTGSQTFPRVACTSDGKWVAIGGASVKVIRASTLDVLWESEDTQTAVLSLMFSRSNDRLAVGRGGSGSKLEVFKAVK